MVRTDLEGNCSSLCSRLSDECMLAFFCTQGTGIVVRELAGGCLCCTLSGPLGVAIAQLVRQAKPDRLIIEPSGLGHPAGRSRIPFYLCAAHLLVQGRPKPHIVCVHAGLLDTLQNEHLRSALDVKAIICLVRMGKSQCGDWGQWGRACRAAMCPNPQILKFVTPPKLARVYTTAHAPLYTSIHKNRS